jgi:hypothetical protein
VTTRTPEFESHRLTIIRRSLTRDQTKYSAGGREKHRKRSMPSMPKLRCLEDGLCPSGFDNQAPIANPDHPYRRRSSADAAAFNSVALSPKQIAAIEKDTRLPGEIGCSYGVSAGVVVRIQARARQCKKLKCGLGREQPRPPNGTERI